MPAYVWVTSLSAVAFVGFVAFGRGWVRAVWYSWQHSAHVIRLTEAEEIPGAEYIGSMNMDDERGYAHPLEPLPAPVVDAEPWRQQIADELAPEALDSDVQPDPYIDAIAAEHGSEWEPREEIVLPACGGWVSGPCLDPGPGDAAVEPPASPGPAEMSESDWTAPPVANPWAEDTGARAGRGGAATVAPTPAPPPSPWLAEQLDVLRTWSEWQQRKAAILGA